MTVYFIKSKSLDLIKIGYSHDAESRIRQLSNRYGDLYLVGLLDGDLNTESQIHSLFANYKVKDAPGREWFVDCEDIREFVDKYCYKPKHMADEWSLQQCQHISSDKPCIRSKLAYLIERKSIEEQRQITVKEVADHTGISEHTLGKYRSGGSLMRFESSTIEAIMQYFNCSLDDILYIDWGK